MIPGESTKTAPTGRSASTSPHHAEGDWEPILIMGSTLLALGGNIHLLTSFLKNDGMGMAIGFLMMIPAIIFITSYLFGWPLILSVGAKL